MSTTVETTVGFRDYCTAVLILFFQAQGALSCLIAVAEGHGFHILVDCFPTREDAQGALIAQEALMLMVLLWALLWVLLQLL